MNEAYVLMWHEQYWCSDQATRSTWSPKLANAFLFQTRKEAEGIQGQLEIQTRIIRIGHT